MWSTRPPAPRLCRSLVVVITRGATKPALHKRSSSPERVACEVGRVSIGLKEA